MWRRIDRPHACPGTARRESHHMRPKLHPCLPMHRALSTALCIGLCALSANAGAQAYPSKPIRFVLPSAAGGNADLVARLLGDAISRPIGQPIIIENRGGGSSLIGNNMVAKAAPDGHTVLFTSSTFAIVASLGADLPYDAARDFSPVGMVGATPILMVTNPGVPANNLKELIAYAKSNPGKLNFASTGNGSPAHLAGELFNTLAKVKTTHVPYKATAQATTDAIGGTIQIAYPSVSSALQYVKTGKLRALGITSLKRSSIAADIAPLSETLPGYQATIWNGILAPAGTPSTVIARLNSELNKVLNTAEIQTKLSSMGVDVETSTPAEFGTFIETEIRKWRGVIKDAGIKVELEK